LFIKPIPDSKASACIHKLGAAYLQDLLLANSFANSFANAFANSFAKSFVTSTDGVTAESA